MFFEFATAGRILFGEGSVREVAPAAAAMGRRALVVTGARPERFAGVMGGPAFAVAGEPSIGLIRQGLEFARNEGCDVVVAIGGGSALDAGKALAALLTNPADPLEYLEVIGKGAPLPHSPAPFVAVPTTAGTGSEVTRNAVLASPEHRVKASLRSAAMLPRLAVVDPELTLDLPRALTAATGLDALTQLIEPYVSGRANAMTDMICVEGIRRAAAALPRALRERAGQRSAPRHVLGQPVGRDGSGQRRLGGGAWFRRTGGRDVPCPARRRLRGHSAVRLRDQRSGSASAGGGGATACGDTAKWPDC